MNTMNHYCFFRIRRQDITYPRTLDIIRKIFIVISIYLVFGLLFQYVYANTKTDNHDPYQAQHGSVWLLPDNGHNNGVYLEALQMHSDVDYTISGNIARAKVTQRFKNSSALWAEGLYVFPLPENAAVDFFRMIIGERIIEGKIKERVAAKKIYEKAKSAGKKASLIEQQRPNVFTTSLANIAPGEEITVEFEFQQTLAYNDGVYRLRFPLLVGPRYHPGQPSTNELTNPAFDASSVYTETDPTGNSNPIRIHLLLDAGVNLDLLRSSYHDIDIQQTSETRYSIATVGEYINTDRDFELVWKPQLNNQPQLSAFNENIDGENYTMLSLLPPDLSYLQQKVSARDVVFVLDISGSMAGTSIEQAKASLLTALDGLSDIDRFNIIWFNDKTGRLFPEAVSAKAGYKDYAKRFIESLQADGGTEMLPALKLALSEQEEFSRFRQIIFLTDGNISNESELFDVIDKQLGTNRLFTIGIGSAPNAYFMRKAANKGRGTFTYIGDVNEVQEKTNALFKKLETPALINIRLELDASQYEIFPAIIPDLYAGETTNILIKGKSLPDNITLRGDYGNQEWQSHAMLTRTQKSGVRIAWAREKIASLMNMKHEANNRDLRETIKKEITETALQHHLVSRYTSLVAVDLTPVNADGLLYRERLKNNLPHGWKKSSTTNGIMLAQTSTNSRLKLLMALALFLTACALIVYNKKSQR